MPLDDAFFTENDEFRRFLILAIGKIIFISPSLNDAWTVFTRVFAFGKNYFDITNLNNQLGYISVIAAIVCSLPVLIIDLIQEKKPETTFLEKFDKKPLALQWTLLALMGICIIWFGFYGSGLPHFDFGYIQF